MPSPRRVVCTGLGMISPLGVGVAKSWSALLASKSGLTNLKDEHAFNGCQSRVAAYVPEGDFKTEFDKHAYLIRNSKQLSRATSFAMIAAHEALVQARLLDSSELLIDKYRKRCGVAIGQGMVDFVDIYENGLLILGDEEQTGTNVARSGFKRLSPYFMTRVLINMSAGNISIRYKMNGPNHCVSTACASGAHSIGDAFNFIRSGQTDLMICGSTDAAINPLAIAGFERLRALCTKFAEEPRKASRPFDKRRSGFVMGEGAGVVVLEELNHARGRGLVKDDIICEILGYGTSADGHHLTAPAPNGLGASLSMKMALEDADLNPAQISHVNAHATSTPLGDDIECNAIEEIFYSDTNDNAKVTVTSCKSAIGHLLGGAGGVESIFAMLTCRDGILPPNINLDEPLETHRKKLGFVRCNPERWETSDRKLLKNSFGFGGTNASLILSNFPNL